MVVTVRSLGLTGIRGYEVTVECFLSGGLPAFDMVGLPDAAVKESRERVRAAVKNCGAKFPVSRITVNLAPARVRKEGTLYDLPILLGILAAAEELKPLPQDAAFLGDSLTVGFSDYQINLSGALICGYTGVGPDAIVNRAAVKSPTRGQEVALDVLAAAQPKKLYILLGTNTLTTLGASDRFLAYYGQMLDELRQTLGEDCIIYVQSIPPVRPAAAEKKPGLASDVLRGVNEQLAQLAASKGCVYLDLWEALADGEGNLKEMIAAPDGVHLSAGNGYGAWVTYLRNHAKYSASNPWIMGSAYSAE